MPQAAKELPKLYNAKEVCEELRIDPKTLRYHVENGDIRFIWIGKRKRFIIPDVLEFLTKQGERICPSTSQKGRHISTTISRSQVIGFTAARKKRKNDRLKG